MNKAWMLVGFILISLVTSALIVRAATISQDIRSRASSTQKEVTPLRFSIVETHPHFYKQANEVHFGKRYGGTGANVTKPFMKIWSAPMSYSETDGYRQVIYQDYFGWDDKPGPIGEWEEWDRKTGSEAVVFRYGGTVAHNSKTTPYTLNFMNQLYKPKDNNYKLPNLYYQCKGMDDANAQNPSKFFSVQQGMIYPSIPLGSNYTSSYAVSVNPNESNRKVESCNAKADGLHYTAVYLRDDFGAASTSERMQKCDQYVPAIFGRNQNANRICKHAPAAGRFDQRYGWQNQAGKWAYGCEALIYAYGYTADPGNQYQKYLRNGELRYQGYKGVAANETFIAGNNNAWWNSRCDSVWNQAPGWIYMGEFQTGTKLYEDYGDERSPVLIQNTYATSSSDVTWGKTADWPGNCSHTAENWCPIGQTCDTGWISGPQHMISCPAKTRLYNNGLHQKRWDGAWRFSGTSQCRPDPSC